MKERARTVAKGSIDRSESIDEFLAKDGLLGVTEDAAIEEIIANHKVPTSIANLGKTNNHKDDGPKSR